MKSILSKIRKLWHNDILYSGAASTSELLSYHKSIFYYIQNEVAVKRRGKRIAILLS